MTAISLGPGRRLGFRRQSDAPRVALPPLSPRLQLVRAVLVLVALVSVSLVGYVVVVSGVQQRAGQQRAYERLRSELAQGTAPIGPTDAEGRILPVGRPIAYLEIPSIGLRQVVVEGTSSSALMGGPGHRRDSPWPGQPGVSVLMGRKAGFGGPFSGISRLERGDVIRVTTGAGAFDYKVSRVRTEGDPLPSAPRQGDGRLLLATAAGRGFFPSGVLRVDASLSTPAVSGPRPLYTANTLPDAEQLLAGDPTTVWALALWLQALLALVLGLVWAWHRWGPARAWIVLLPPMLLIAFAAAGEATRLLPNLL